MRLPTLILANTDLTDVAKSTRDLSTESPVLAALFLFGVIAFAIIRWGAWPLARTVLEIMKEISGITTALKGMVDRVERAAEKIEDHGSGTIQRNGVPSALN